jgi:hypothetical protein
LNTYDIGDRRRLSAAFRDEDSSLADPTTVTFWLREPDGYVMGYVYGVDAELVRDSLGTYHVDWDITAPGVHHWRFECTGNIAVAEESRFMVRESLVLDEPS